MLLHHQTVVTFLNGLHRVVFPAVIKLPAVLQHIKESIGGILEHVDVFGLIRLDKGVRPNHGHAFLRVGMLVQIVEFSLIYGLFAGVHLKIQVDLLDEEPVVARTRILIAERAKAVLQMPEGSKGFEGHTVGIRNDVSKVAFFP